MSENEEGFTLVELCIAIMILLIVIVPLVGSFVVGVKASIDTQQDVSNSADAQLLGYYFDIDVSSAESVSPTSPGCGDTGGGTGSVIELTWPDGGTTTVAYRAVVDAARQAELKLSTTVYRLERVSCTAAGTEVTSLGRTLTAAPTVLCDGAACTAAQKPRRVSIEVKELSTQQSDIASTDTFTYAVTAARKVTP